MLSVELLLAVLALVVRVSCANDFVTTGDNAFPSEFGLNTETKFYWDNISGYIAGIRVAATEGRSGEDDEDGDDNWILTPQCDDTCTGFTNNGSASFGGSLAVDSSGSNFTVGSGYTIHLLYAATQIYDDIDTDTTSVVSPGFSIVNTVSVDTTTSSSSSGLSPGAKAGTAIGVILGVFFFLGILWLVWRRKRRNKRRKTIPGDEDDIMASSTLSQMRETSSSQMAPGAKRTERPGHGRPYLDDKVELLTQGNAHELPLGMIPAPLINVVSPPGPAPVELPASSINHSAPKRGSAAEPVFHFNPNPSYALLSPTSPGGVSDVSSSPDDDHREGAAAEDGSPVSPIVRRPVGSVRERGIENFGPLDRASKQKQQVVSETVRPVEVAPSRGKSALLKKQKSRIWKMLGGGSLHDKLKPANGTSS